MPEPTDELLAARGKTHGDFAVHAGCTQELKDVLRKWMSRAGKSPHAGYTASQLESLDMICHKLGRIAAGDPNEPDHWDDIAGYARLVSKELTK